MNRKLLMLTGLVTLMLASACVVRGTVRTRATAPSMVLVSDGVYVIEDYDEPVFYSDGFYWRYYGNVWYRSSYHTGGWVRWSNVPNRVHRIDRPHTYVHYRGHGNARHDRPKARDHRTPTRVQHSPRDNRPKARDHRAPTRAQPTRGNQPAARDHRAPKAPRGRVKPKQKDADKPEKRRH